MLVCINTGEPTDEPTEEPGEVVHVVHTYVVTAIVHVVGFLLSSHLPPRDEMSQNQRSE